MIEQFSNSVPVIFFSCYFDAKALRSRARMKLGNWELAMILSIIFQKFHMFSLANLM
jgi:hypothetical protein